MAASESDVAEARANGDMPLMDHLVELRGRLIKCAIAFGICAIIAYAFAVPFLEWVNRPLCALDPANIGDRAAAADASGALTGTTCEFYLSDPLEGFSVRLQIGGYGGLVLALPVLVWQLWGFVSPGLYKHERRWGAGLAVACSLLFGLGASLGFWTMPRALAFLTGSLGDDTNYLPRPGSYLTFVIYMALGFGFSFLLPVVLVMLQLLGVVEPKTLAGSRRYAVVGIVVIAAVVTPSGDPLSLAVLSVPMYLLFEASILIGKLLRRRRPDGLGAGPPDAERIDS